MRLTRRAFCATSLGAGTTFLLSPFGGTQIQADSTDHIESPLPPAHLQQIGVDAFSDEELDLPYYVAHFHRIANSVVLQGQDQGFISISVWRNARDNMPYNARIMENILSLAFFYASKRPWNPFYGDRRLRRRLELALDFWCKSSNNGHFSEYSQGGYNLAATAFATKFMGETLFLLRNNVPEVDADLMDRTRKTNRRAIETVFSDTNLLRHGARFSNQFTNAYAGALAYLDIIPDEELKTLLEKTVREMVPQLQSPVGFFYENNGPDWSYNLGTHHSNLRMCWFYTRGTELGEIFAEEERLFVDWLSYNAVYDPVSKGFWLNKQVETRQSLGFWRGYPAGSSDTSGTFIREAAPLTLPFLPTQEEKQKWITTTRDELKTTLPEVPPLQLRNFYAFSPYRFLHRRHSTSLPSREEKEQAMRLLPYLAKESFTQQRCDSRVKTCFTFIRRPAYYLIFNSGARSTAQQCFGLGLLWTPTEGVILQSQRHPAPVWGTKPEGREKTVECDPFFPTFFAGNKEFQPTAGIQNLNDEPFRVQYEWEQQGRKVLECSDTAIKTTVDCSGRFVEYFPLFFAPDTAYRLDRSQFLSGRTRLSFTGALTTQVKETDLTVGEKKLFLLEVSAQDRLEYVFS